MRISRQNSLNHIQLFFLACFITACTTTSNVIDIQGSDKTSFPTLEMTYHNPDDGPNIMFRATRTDGTFIQSIPDPKYVEWPTATIYGPTDINGVVDISYTSISMGFETTTIENEAGIPADITGKFYFGLNQTFMDIRLTHPSAEYTEDDKTTELYVLLGVSFPIRDSLRGGLSYANSIGQDVSGISELDMRIDYMPFRHIGIMVGLRKFEYMYNVRTDVSDIIIKFRGPFIGLNVVF